MSVEVLCKEGSKEEKKLNGKLSNGNGKVSSSSLSLPPQKSILITYALWLFGGLFGLHHLYLHRDRHAFIWWSTLGGYLGFGWLSEIFLIPEYVRDANEDPRFIKPFVAKMRVNQRPPFSSKRFMGEVMIGYLFGQLVMMAIPETPVASIDWSFLHWLIPFFIALGVWTVGNIGRERGALHHCLIVAFAVYPVRYILYNDTNTIVLTALICALVFDNYSKRWLRTPPVRHGTTERALKFSGAMFIYFSLWGCFLYFNGTITTEEGEQMPFYEYLHSFLETSWWQDLKAALIETYNYGQHNGWYQIWKEIFDSIDVEGERNAYITLDVSATASQAEITAAYRKLSKEYHPDKIKDEVERNIANQRFIEIQQAYNILSKTKSSRRRKNRKYSEEL